MAAPFPDNTVGYMRTYSNKIVSAIYIGSRKTKLGREQHLVESEEEGWTIYASAGDVKTRFSTTYDTLRAEGILSHQSIANSAMQQIVELVKQVPPPPPVAIASAEVCSDEPARAAPATKSAREIKI